MKTFILTEEHLKLLRAANVGWCCDEFGAPCIDPKRPYGNSDVIGDIAKILDEPDTCDEIGQWSRAVENRLYNIHRETETALQIGLATGSFEPGTYQGHDCSRDWWKVKPAYGS